MICDRLTGGGTEPLDREAHIVEAKTTPKRVDVNLVETEVKLGKLKNSI